MKDVMNKQEETKKELIGFLSIIIDEIDFQRRTHGKLAEQIGISSGLLSRSLSGKNQFNFWSLIKLLNILYENDSLQKHKLIYRFCLLTTSKKNLRIAMEYAHAKGDLDLLKQLIDQEKTSSLATNREWAYVYDLVWIRGQGTLIGKELLEKLESSKKGRVIKTTEMNALYDVLTCYIMYDIEKVTSFFEYIEISKPKFTEIKDEFIRNMYEIRMKEVHAAAHLLGGNIKTCRKLCNEIIDMEDLYDIFSIQKASAYAYLAESYTFDCFETASNYVEMSLQYLDTLYFKRAEVREKQILNTYGFMQMVQYLTSEKPLFNLNEIEVFHPAEQALLETLKGNRDKAIEVLNNMKKENGYLLPIEYCYLGLAMNDIDYIKKSIELFRYKGGGFYSKLPSFILEYFSEHGIMYRSVGK